MAKLRLPLAGAGVASAIRPGILCSLAAIAAGYLMDVFVCQPAETLYSKEVSCTQRALADENVKRSHASCVLLQLIIHTKFLSV